MKIPFSRHLLFALLPASLAAGAAADAPKRHPNVVILYADDLGYGDVQCYNRERGKIPTPHLDRLAAQGIRFTDGHSSSGVCSPSRYALLTGRYHWRTRLQSGIVPVWGEPLITPDRLTIATLAKAQGYRTACIGKWHLGWDWRIPPDRAALFKHKPKDSTPRNRSEEVPPPAALIPTSAPTSRITRPSVSSRTTAPSASLRSSSTPPSSGTTRPASRARLCGTGLSNRSCPRSGTGR
jgi:arylsulfatase A-like enzyme